MHEVPTEPQQAARARGHDNHRGGGGLERVSEFSNPRPGVATVIVTAPTTVATSMVATTTSGVTSLRVRPQHRWPALLFNTCAHGQVKHVAVVGGAVGPALPRK